MNEDKLKQIVESYLGEKVEFAILYKKGSSYIPHKFPYYTGSNKYRPKEDVVHIRFLIWYTDRENNILIPLKKIIREERLKKLLDTKKRNPQ